MEFQKLWTSNKKIFLLTTGEISLIWEMSLSSIWVRQYDFSSFFLELILTNLYSEMNLPSQQMEEPVFPPISHLLSTSSNLKNEEESLQSHPPEEPEIELLSLAPPQQRPHRKPTVLIDSQIILSDATMRSHFEDTSELVSFSFCSSLLE